MSSYLDLMGPLKLSGMKESVEYRLEEAIQGNLDYQEFLCLILEDEKLYRENRKSERLRKRAKFNDFTSLEDFDSSVERGVTKSMIKKLASLHFVERNENIIFTGGTGTGKSYLAQAIGQKACLSAGTRIGTSNMTNTSRRVFSFTIRDIIRLAVRMLNRKMGST